MTKKLFEGMKNAKLGKQMRIMMLSALFVMAGTVIMSARSSDSQATSETQQNKIRITGVVVDQTGEPMIGANVVEKGVATNGTITDMDGKFTLEAAANATLQISFIGYITQEINVSGQNNLTVTLAEDNLSLEEVVVVGYGTQKKVTLTGSVVTAKGADIIKSPAVNVTNSLAGRLPGVIINNRSGEPGRENTSLYIRGRSTTGNTSALVIIDGVERSGLESINPNDIENISVLKDASAAIYGSRAANGVILVTTKRGNSAKPLINFSYNQGFTQPTRNPIMADSYTFSKVYNETEIGAGRSPMYTDEEVEKYRNGTDPDYPNTNWYKFIIKDWTPQHRSNLSVSGGSNSAKYYLSFGELRQDGQFYQGSTRYVQYNIRSNVDVQITDNLAMGMNIAGRYDRTHYPWYSASEIFSHVYLYPSTWQPFWPGTDKMMPLRGNENILNMVSDNVGTINTDIKTMQTSLFLKWDLPWVKGLSVDGSGSYDAATNFTKTWRTPAYVWYKNEVTGELEERLSGMAPARATLSNRTDMSSLFYLTVKANYERSFGQHNIAALAGYEQTQIKGSFLSAYRNDYVSTSIPQLFAGSTDKTQQGNDGSASQDAKQNIFGRLGYDYAGKYMAQFTLRRDGSPRFPKEKRYGIFPGASVGWRLSEESFMQNMEFVNNLKVRGSYGKMGNDLVDAFQYLTSYAYGNNYVVGGNDVAGLTESGVPNPNITWETVVTWNGGLDVSLWKGLFGLELDVFKTKRSDILRKRNASVPRYTGLTLPDENIGVVENKGFELVLRHEHRVGDFTYNVTGNMSFARNKVIFIDEAPGAEPYQLETGRPIGSSLYYHAIGIFRDENHVNSYPHLLNARPGDIIYEDVNGDGEINSRDQIRENMTNIPEIVYGLTANVVWKGFDLSLLFQGQENAKQFFGDYFSMMNYSQGNFVAWRGKDRWSPDHMDATMPRPENTNANNNRLSSTQWLINAGFLRLKNMELGYNLPKQICTKFGMQNLRISVSGHNLFFIYDHMKEIGLDAETTAYWYYSQQRVWNLGLGLTF
jgi:TonB-linked SusC/RagA family outer membrane protein